MPVLWCDGKFLYPKSHHLPPGTILEGKYVIGRVLGEGGFGITYVGRDINLDVKVAIKEYYPGHCVIRDHLKTNYLWFTSPLSKEYFEKDRNHFLQEAKTLWQLRRTRGIVEVYEFFPENGTAYIVMEFLEGINLADYANNNGGKLPFRDVMNLMKDPVEALDIIHSAGICHRDISPDNLMLLKDGTVKLIDFGSSATDQNPKTSLLKVKPGYSPFEMYLTDVSEGPYTDEYSLAATIYRLITGKKPPQANLRDAMMLPSQLGAVGITHKQEMALLKAMSLNPSDRYPSVGTFYEALTKDEKKASFIKPGDARKPENGRRSENPRPIIDTRMSATKPPSSCSPRVKYYLGGLALGFVLVFLLLFFQPWQPRSFTKDVEEVTDMAEADITEADEAEAFTVKTSEGEMAWRQKRPSEILRLLLKKKLLQK